MNTRIRELAKQADDGYTGINNDDMGDALIGEDAIEKFAELIIVDVINRAERYGLGCDAVEQLKEDFGVEE